MTSFMKPKDVEKKVYRSLKTGGKTIDEIQVDVGSSVSKKRISIVLDKLLKDGWVERYANEYRLRYVLGNPISTQKKKQDWQYETIQSLQGKEEERPAKYTNPYVDWIPHCDQGDRGTCCGFAGHYKAWLLQLNLLTDKPNKEDVQKIVYDVPVEVWGKCRMLVDQKHELAPSAEGLYNACREIENVTYPSGCWIRGVVRAMKSVGYTYEKDQMTSKVSRCVPIYYPRDKEYLEEQGKDHKIDGYSAVTTWDGLKDAIYNYGCALIAINVYDNLESRGKDVILPDPKGSVIGSHALCAVGYDEGYIYFLHSWRAGWSKLGGISKKYYDTACGTAYVAQDSADVGIAHDLYGTITVITNVPCDIWIGKDKYEGNKVKISAEFDKYYTIVASPQDTWKYMPSEQTAIKRVTKESPDVIIEFPFVDKEIKDRIRELIERILNRLGIYL